jgi:TolB-like protein/class 3 adenylate cyclase
MTDERANRKMSAILSADVKGYSRLMSEDEEGTVKALNDCREIIARCVDDHRGRIVDSPGDNVLAEFVSTVEAVKCSVKIQEDLKVKNADLPESRRMEFRIGVNLGDVIEEEDRIYGDGVNIAARLEGLAEAGGICISGTAFDQVKGKFALGYQFVGRQFVKNIPDPIRAYKVLTEPENVGKVIGEDKHKNWRLAAISMAVVLVLFAGGFTIWNFFLEHSAPSRNGVSDKTSIAVLPFDNMSNDPEQEYFSNGISDDLITDLSKVPNFLVISRNTSFAYRGKSLSIEQIAEELDVRYVLEGSVQKANNLVRINAQLIDATTGHPLWAERYDGNTSDIFALQDKITQKITTSLEVKLTDDEQNRLTQKGTNNIEAYEAFLKGNDLANYLNMDPDGFAKSIPWFEKAIQLDPEFSRAYAALAESYVRGVIVGVHGKLGISRRLAILRAFNYLRISMKNPTNASYRNIARLYINQRLHEKAVDHSARAIALDPNNANSNSVMALTLINSGRPDEAVVFCERMRRIDPACLF